MVKPGLSRGFSAHDSQLSIGTPCYLELEWSEVEPESLEIQVFSPQLGGESHLLEMVSDVYDVYDVSCRIGPS